MVDFSKIDRAAFRRFGKAATFTPRQDDDEEPVPVPCTIIVSNAVEISGVGYAGIPVAAVEIQVRLSEVSDPEGGTFTLGAKSWVVASAPTLDGEQITWTCPANPV